MQNYIPNVLQYVAQLVEIFYLQCALALTPAIIDVQYFKPLTSDNQAVLTQFTQKGAKKNSNYNINLS